MKNYSLTYAGIIAAAIAYVFQSFNIQIPYTNEDIEKAITVLVAIGGLLVALIGRYRKGDLHWTGFRLNLPIFSGRKVVNEGEEVQF